MLYTGDAPIRPAQPRVSRQLGQAGIQRRVVALDAQVGGIAPRSVGSHLRTPTQPRRLSQQRIDNPAKRRSDMEDDQAMEIRRLATIAKHWCGRLAFRHGLNACEPTRPPTDIVLCAQRRNLATGVNLC